MVGTRETLTFTFPNNSSGPIDMTDTCTFATGVWKTWQPDGTLMINGAIVFTTRMCGIISYTIGACDTPTTNEGVWAGEVEIKDNMCPKQITAQSETFQFTQEVSE